MKLHNPPEPKSILGIDVGKRRIGIAGCDPLGITINRLPPLHRESFDEDLKIIKGYCSSRNVQGIIIGIPLNSNGMPTKQAKYCQKYGLQLIEALKLPIAWVNEHSSSWAAGEKYNLKKDKSGELDSAAAALLVEQWLREGPELKPVRMASLPHSQVDSDSGS